VGPVAAEGFCGPLHFTAFDRAGRAAFLVLTPDGLVYAGVARR
jgi:hypothetical protein